MPVLLKLIYKFNVIPIKIPTSIYFGVGKVDIKVYMEK